MGFECDISGWVALALVFVTPVVAGLVRPRRVRGPVTATLAVAYYALGLVSWVLMFGPWGKQLWGLYSSCVVQLAFYLMIGWLLGLLWQLILWLAYLRP